MTIETDARQALDKAEEFIMGGEAAVARDPLGAVGTIDDLHDLLEEALEQDTREPSDAEVLAALNAYYADYMIGPNTSLDDVRPPRTVKDMRAALLAAQQVRRG